MKQQQTTIEAALADPSLLGAALGELKTWRAWFVVLRGAFGLMAGVKGRLPGAPNDRSNTHRLGHSPGDLFAVLAGGREPPRQRVKEAWFVVGRRSGKSRMAAAIACYIAAFGEHRLVVGESGHVVVLSPTRAQSAIIFDYCQGFLEASPILRQQVESISADEIRLNNGVVISVTPANYRTLRGRTLLAVIADESAFWKDETSSQPDIEVYRAAAPALAASGGMWIAVSSPYAQRGLLFERFKRHFGKAPPESEKAGDVLVIQADSKTLNPTLSDEIIAAAERDDPESAAAEWGGKFRGDIATYISREAVEACVESGCFERPFDRRFRHVAFVDPSGGSHDSMTLAVAHRDGERVILDCVREVKAPFSPPDVVAEFMHVLARYHVRSVTGDRYAGEWPAAAFGQHGIRYVAAERSKSEIYRDALPLLNSGLATLLDNKTMVDQISRLERRTSRGARGDSIDHPPGERDDVSNAVAGALVTAPSRAVIPHYGGDTRPAVAESYQVLG